MKIKVMGPYNSGTNLMINILYNNTHIGDKKSIQVFSNNHVDIWKHCNNEKTIRTYLDQNNDVCIIFMYKNFYNLIHSIKKQCHNIGFKNIYKDRIHFRGKLMKDPKHIREKYDSFMDFYYEYYRTFKNILEDSKYKGRVIFVDYGKIIDKSSCFEYLQSKLSKIYECPQLLSKEHVWNKLATPSKKHHTTVANSDEALKNYKPNNRKIYRELMKENNKFCRNFDKSLERFYAS
jgi:hypothetical protein